MARGFLRTAIAATGAAVAWRVAAEVETERRRIEAEKDELRQQRRAVAPVTVVRPDGSTDQVAASVAVAAAPAAGQVVHADTSNSSGTWLDAHRAVIAAAGSVVGVSATFWALTNPIETLAWPAAIGGVALAAVGRQLAASGHEAG